MILTHSIFHRLMLLGFSVALIVASVSGSWHLMKESQDVTQEAINNLEHRFAYVQEHWDTQIDAQLYQLLNLAAYSPELHAFTSASDHERIIMRGSVERFFTTLHQHQRYLQALHFVNYQGIAQIGIIDGKRARQAHHLLDGSFEHATEHPYHDDLKALFIELESAPPYTMRARLAWAEGRTPTLIVGYSIQNFAMGRFGGALFMQLDANSALTNLAHAVDVEHDLLIQDKHGNTLFQTLNDATADTPWLLSLLVDTKKLTRSASLLIGSTPVVDLTVTLNHQHTYARLLRAIETSAIAFILALIPAIFFIRMQAQQISAPITTLQRGAEAVAKGNLEHRVAIIGNDEISSLGTSFNHAVASIKEAQKKLASSYQYSQNIMHAMTEALFVMDHNGYIVTVNPAMRTMLDYHEDDLIGKPFTDLFSGHQNFHQQHVENPHVLRNVSSRLQRLANHDYEKFCELYQKSPLGTIIIDRHANILDCNHALKAQTGWSAQDLRHQHIEMLIPERMRKGHASKIKLFFLDPSPRNMERGRVLPMLMANGQETAMEISLLPFNMHDEPHVLILLNNPEQRQLWDMFQLTHFGHWFGTEQSQLSKQQLYAKEYMKHQNGSIIPVELAGAMLHDAQLGIEGAVVVIHDLRAQIEHEKNQQLQLEIEASNIAAKAKDDFLAAMSHELRTPLSSMLGNGELLSDSALDTQQRQLLRTMQHAGSTLLCLINDILDISKIEAGKFEMDEAPFDLNALLQELETMFQKHANDAGVTFRINNQLHLEHHLLGDGLRVRQVLTNLISNALKFTARGHVNVRIVPAPDNHFQIQVEDQGIGMPADVVQRLFNPFEQADKSISRRFGGTGLGLYISHQLVQLMDGDIHVQSQEGVGSTFTVSLPLRLTDKPLPTSSASPMQAITQEKFTGRVLIAEDTKELQIMELMFLRRFGLDADIAANGLIALEKGKANDFDLILMDMQMPEMDGIEATRELRKAGCTTPIVALTANVMQKHKDMFVEAGGDDFLSKPIDKAELHRVLKTYLAPVNA